MPGKFIISSIYKAVDKFTAPIKRMEAASLRFAKKTSVGFARVERAARRLSKPIDKILGKFVRMGALVGGLSLGLAINAGATAIIDLDKNISAASAKFQIFDRESDVFKRIRDTAIELGATTEFTSGQAAEALNNMAAAGFNVQQSLAGISTVLDLATASQSELATAATISGKAMAAFGLKSDDPKIMAKNLGVVANVLNKLKSGKEFQSLEEILVTITGSGAAAKLAGQDINTWATLVGSAIGPLGDASKVGTQLNMAMTRLAKPVGEAGKLINGLGIKVDDGKGNFRDFLDIIDDVSKATKTMGTRQKAAALSTIFGARSYKVISVLIDKGADSLKEYRKEIKSSQGLTTKMASFMRTGLSGGINAMKASFESIAITLGDTFQPEIDATIKKLTKAAKGSRAWFQENKQLIKNIAKLVKWIFISALALKSILLAISLVKGAMIAWAAITGVVKTAWIALNIVMSANPIGLIIIAIAALIAGIILMVRHWDKIKAKIDQFSNTAVFQILSLIIPIVKIIELIAFMQDRWDGIKNAFKDGGFLNGIKAIGKAILSFVLKPIEVLVKAIGKLTGLNFASIVGNKIGNIRGGLDEGLVGRDFERAKNVNVSKTQNDVQTQRFEEITKNNIGIELTNRTDKDFNITKNPALIPILSNTQAP